MIEQGKRVLKRYYGYENFRKEQEEIVTSILEKRNTLGVLPTGGGKSICYQVPALVFGGMTLVISPLISLMKDQVDNLRILGIPSAYLNSSLSKDEYKRLYYDISRGRINILYVSPERLQNEGFVKLIQRSKLNVVAVDEAHCISQWGHDFRKSYLKIPEFLRKIGKEPQIVALTATATSKVREDIIDKLEMGYPKVFVAGFDRSNLSFEVIKGEDPEEYIIDYLDKNRKQAGIIYASTRKEVDHLYSYLKIKSFSVGKYHAGMDEKEKKENQEKFIKDDIRIMIATNAFGMGIDKSNVRFVIHRNIPKDIESYYQEAGRGGRDGLNAECILLYNPEDVALQEYLIDNNKEINSEHKREKFKKLEAMINFCESNSCYREYFLKYFGDKRIKSYCGFCGNCMNKKGVIDLTIDAQKILSCIGRLKGGFGSRAVIKILVGEESEKIKRKGFTELSTFGLMKDYTKEKLEEFINYLISESYIDQTAGSYPVLKLNKRSYQVLKSKSKITRHENERVTFDYFEDPLFEDLNKLRKEIAEREDIAPYIVFSDVTLIELAERKPRNRWEMLKIQGVGNQKFENYGEVFLKLIEKYREDEGGNLEKEIFAQDELLTEEKLNSLKVELGIKIANRELKRVLLKHLF